jgi:hypothetical protein
MTKATFDVPTLWADHHVLKVREALLGLDGVDDVYASSAWKQVLVTYNKKIKKADIENRRDPQWAEGVRMTQTNRADLEMSGEFRRY